MIQKRKRIEEPERTHKAINTDSNMIKRQPLIKNLHLRDKWPNRVNRCLAAGVIVLVVQAVTNPVKLTLLKVQGPKLNYLLVDINILRVTPVTKPLLHHHLDT